MQRIAIQRSRRAWLSWVLITGGGLLLAGCGRDARLADHDVRLKAVGTVTAYGLTLDQAADPEETVYVFLRAVLDDYAAGQDAAAREKAFDTQLATAATEEVKTIVSRGRELPEQTVTEQTYDAIRHWAPVFGYYREDLDVDYPTLKSRCMTHERIAQKSGRELCDVYLNVQHPDPEQRPHSNVVGLFKLTRVDGYWRIWWVGWESSTRNWKEQPPRGFAARTGD